MVALSVVMFALVGGLHSVQHAHPAEECTREPLTYAITTLDARLRPVARLVLYEAREGDGYSVSTTFRIAEDFTITTARERRTDAGKVISERSRRFRVSAEGKFVRTK